MLGSWLKQVVNGMERISEQISRAFQEHTKAIGGRALRLPDIVKIPQSITSSQPTFIFIDERDECVAVHRAKILDSRKQIIEKSTGTRIFMTGRSHTRAEFERGPGGRVINVFVGPKKDHQISSC